MAEQRGYTTLTIPVATPTLSEVLASLDFAPKSVYMTTEHALSLFRESKGRLGATDIRHGLCRLERSEYFDGVVCPPANGGPSQKSYCVCSRTQFMNDIAGNVLARI